jgi:DNA-directed RNA polymerase specialized sigma subunit
MTAKEYLSQIQRIQTRLAAMSEQLVCLKSAAEYISPQISDMPKPATRNVHKSEDAIVRVMEWERKMGEQYNILADINATIDKVSDPLLQSVLVKRYVGGKTWMEIARETFMCERHIRRLHRQALDEVDVLLEDVR